MHRLPFRLGGQAADKILKHHLGKYHVLLAAVGTEPVNDATPSRKSVGAPQGVGKRASCFRYLNRQSQAQTGEVYRPEKRA